MATLKMMVRNMMWSVMLMLLLMASCSAGANEEDLPSAEAITLVVKPEDIDLPPTESGSQGCWDHFSGLTYRAAVEL